MPLTKKELNIAAKLEQMAINLNAAHNEFAQEMANLLNTVSHTPNAYALSLALLKASGMKAAADTLEAGIKARLNLMPNATAQSEPIVLTHLSVPAYLFKSKTVDKAELLDKSDKTFLHVLQAIVDAGRAGAIEKRLKGSEFTPDMLKACAGMVNVTESSTWSVTKAKV